MWTEINLNQQRGDIRIMQTDAEGPERNELRSLDSENPPLMTPEEVATAHRVCLPQSFPLRSHPGWNIALEHVRQGRKHKTS
jgi:hypothetical protein